MKEIESFGHVSQRETLAGFRRHEHVAIIDFHFESVGPSAGSSINRPLMMS